LADQTPKQTEDLLHRLNGNDPGAAWAEFIDLYSPLILKLAHQFEYEQDRGSECFLYVCEKLCEGGFQRLLSFNTRGKASFRTWLGSVAFNLCVDWHRREFGRARMLPAISALPVFDQAVYRLCFEQGQDKQTSLNLLQEEFPDLSARQLSDAAARVHRVLTPRQRWKLGVWRQRRPQAGKTDFEPDWLPDIAKGPESEAQESEIRDWLFEALATLPRDLKLAVELRYIQGLTLQQVADTLGLENLSRARNLIQSALDRLSARFESRSGRKKL
jgi:RNA polymerase sigma factor (sigma-70 family)